MKAKLREVHLIFHVPVPGEVRDWRLVTVQCGVLNHKLSVTFSVPAIEAGEILPEAIIEGLQEAVAWAKKNVRARDLVELDPPECDE